MPRGTYDSYPACGKESKERERYRERRERKNNSFFEKRERKEKTGSRIQKARESPGRDRVCPASFPRPILNVRRLLGDSRVRIFGTRIPGGSPGGREGTGPAEEKEPPDTHRPDERGPTSPTSAEPCTTRTSGSRCPRRESEDFKASVARSFLQEARVTLRRAGGRGAERSRAEPAREEQNSPPFTPARSTSESPTSPTHRDAGGSA